MEPTKTQASIPVSVIVITRNEEKNIAKCLNRLTAYDEVFVVDSASTDRTQEIARGLGANVVEFRWNGQYPKKKQWSLENLPFRNDWVLWVDADEEVYPELTEEIRELMRVGPPYQGYFVAYDYVFMGRVLKHGQQIYKLVFHDRRKGRFIEQDDLDVKTTGDQEVHVHPRIDGKVGVLHHKMLHDDHDSLHHYFDRHNWYSDWEAALRAKKLAVNSGAPQPGVRGMMKRVFDRLPGKPLLVFLYSFVFKAGALDGSSGFHYAISKAVYYWQIGIKIREYRIKNRL